MSIPVACDLTHLTCFLFFFLAGFFCGGTHRAHEIDTGSYPGTPLFLLGARFTEQGVIGAPSQERASTTADATLALRCTPRHPYMVCVCVCARTQMLIFINVILEISDCFLEENTAPFGV